MLRRIFARKNVVGLEINDREIKAGELKEKSMDINLVNIGRKELPPGAVKEGIVVKPQEVGQSLKELWKEENFRGKDVVIGVANQGVLVRFASFPRVDGKKLDNMVRYQAGDYMPVSLEDDSVVFDYSVIGEKTEGDSTMCEVLLVAGKKDMINDFIEALYYADLNPREVEVLPLSLLRLVDLSNSSKVLAIVDLSYNISNLLIAENKKPRLARMMPTPLDEELEEEEEGEEKEEGKEEGKEDLVIDPSEYIDGEEDKQKSQDKTADENKEEPVEASESISEEKPSLKEWDFSEESYSEEIEEAEAAAKEGEEAEERRGEEEGIKGIAAGELESEEELEEGSTEDNQVKKTAREAAADSNENNRVEGIEINLNGEVEELDIEVVEEPAEEFLQEEDEDEENEEDIYKFLEEEEKNLYKEKEFEEVAEAAEERRELNSWEYMVVNNIRVSVDFYQSQANASPVEKVLITGKNTQNDALIKEIEEQIGVEVEIVNPLDVLAITNTIEAEINPVEYAISLCLAYKGLEVS